MRMKVFLAPWVRPRSSWRCSPPGFGRRREVVGSPRTLGLWTRGRIPCDLSMHRGSIRLLRTWMLGLGGLVVRWIQAHRRSSAIVTMGTGWMQETPTAAATKEWMVTFVYDPTLRLLSEFESQIGKKGCVERWRRRNWRRRRDFPRL